MGYRVLVVDDEPIIRADLCQMLEDQGMEIVGEAADGFDAVELCRCLRPDVALMDIHMPLFEGLSALETITKEELAGTVILLTAFADPAFIRRAGQAGAGGYLVKPIVERDLLPTIEIGLAHSRALLALRRELADSRESARQKALIDRAKALLAKEKSISEADAYRLLQKLAMDKRTGMAQLSESLLAQDNRRAELTKAKQLLMDKTGCGEKEAFHTISTEMTRTGCTPMEAAKALAARRDDK